MQTIFIPLLTGLLGWAMIWLFAKSLFFPTNSIQIGRFKWKSGFALLVDQFPIEFFIANEHETDAQFKAMQPLMEQKLDHFFSHTIQDKLPMLSMFIGDKTTTQLKTVFLDELALIFPEIIGQFAQKAKKKLTDGLANKLASTLAPILMKAIKPYQWLAFVIGLGWGYFILYLLK